MTKSVINFMIFSSPSSSKWVNITEGSLAVYTLKDASDASDLPWTVNYRDGATSSTGNSQGFDGVGIGDASFVDENAVSLQNHAQGEVGVWSIIDIKNLDDTKSYNLKGFSTGAVERVTDWRVNGGGTVITLPNYDSVNNQRNNSQVALFSEVSPSSGQISIEYTKAASATFTSGVSAIEIEEITPPPDPEATLDDAALEPGKAITGTYANYTSAPTVVTLTDSEGNTVSSASEITDLVIDDSAKTYAFTMPDRITTGTGTTLLRGDITVELT